jgi:hypothetical protein
MARPGLMRLGAVGGLCAVLLGGCVSIGELVGLPQKGDPSVEIKASGSRWVLIKNPRFGDVPSEPEYIWVEEDKMPTSVRTLVFGKSSILAPPEIVAKYGPPPGGGQISPRHRLPQNTAAPAEAPPARSSAPDGARAAAPANSTAGRAPATGPPKGLVVYVDTDRIVIDLTARDGVRLGSVVSLRRDAIPIVHPVTGEVLGELDQEVATGKVTEVREKFSVVEIQSVSPGAEIKVKDRAVVR